MNIPFSLCRHVFANMSSYSPSDYRRLVDVKQSSRETTLCLAAAHALVKLDDGTVVGDPMEKTTLEALDWVLGKGTTMSPSCLTILIHLSGDVIAPSHPNAPHRAQLTIRRRFQFSSALKRMSTLSNLPGGKLLVSVKGAPETIKNMLAVVPDHYDDTYKFFTRKGSRVLALATKEMDALSTDKVSFSDNANNMENS